MERYGTETDARIVRLPRLPLWRKIMYALGQLGWSLCCYGAGNFLTQFYLPFAEGGTAIYPRMIHQGYVIGFLTVIGLALGVGRIFDAVTDPLVAVLSDRSRAALGRRRGFLAFAALPFALFSALVFVPVGGAGDGARIVLNSVWLFACITALYWFMTMYVTPFFAWMSELGRDADERLQLATMISITWAIGAMIGAQAPVFQGMFQARGMSALRSFQVVMGIFAGASFVLMMLPVLFIDERKYCASVPSEEGLFASVAKVVADRNFLAFTLSDFAYWISLYFVNNGLLYYVTVLLGLPKETYSLLFIAMFVTSFLFYVPVGLLAKRVGRRRLLIAAFVIFGALFCFCSLFGIMPLSAPLQAGIAAILAAVPMAIFGILPNAMVSDMAEACAIETGASKAGVFFGFRTFMQKLGQFVGALILPSIVMIGADRAAGEVVGERGVRMTTFFALGFCALGLLLLLIYSEKKVMASLAKREEGTAVEH